MRLIGAGVVLMLLGLAALLAMVVRVVTPGLALALIAFGATFTGVLLALLGLIRRITASSK